MLVVDGVVGRRRGCFALLVCMARRRVCGSVCSIVIIVVVVDNNDLSGDAVLVKIGPVRVPASMSRAGVGRAHVDRGWVRDGGQLGGLSVVGSCSCRCSGSAQVRGRGAASVAVVERIAYPTRAVGNLGIGDVWLVSVVVRIKLMMGRECGRGGGGCRHGWAVVPGHSRSDVVTLLSLCAA